jgi:hypothetical protein
MLTGITTYLFEISLTLVWKCLHISTHLFLSSGSISICVKNLFAMSSSASSGQAVNLNTNFAIKKLFKYIKITRLQISSYTIVKQQTNKQTIT